MWNWHIRKFDLVICTNTAVPKSVWFVIRKLNRSPFSWSWLVSQDLPITLKTATCLGLWCRYGFKRNRSWSVWHYYSIICFAEYMQEWRSAYPAIRSIHAREYKTRHFSPTSTAMSYRLAYHIKRSLLGASPAAPHQSEPVMSTAVNTSAERSLRRGQNSSVWQTDRHVQWRWHTRSVVLNSEGSFLTRLLQS